MAAATFAGSLLPAIPAAVLPAPWAIPGVALVLAVVGAGIAETRSRTQPRWRAYTTTTLVLAAASGLSAAVALLLGAVG